MKTYNIDSSAHLGVTCENFFTETQIKNEPMLFSCDYKNARKLGGEITNFFLDNLKSFYSEWISRDDFILDTRVHMLMPNFYPCIPGWHHDDVPRTKENKQPNYNEPGNAKHCMMLINGDIAPTEFAVGNINLPEIAEDKKIYKEWHPLINDAIKNKKLKPFSCPSNQLIFFDKFSFHRGTKAVKFGWRWFARATINSSERKFLNETRKQVQVYIDLENEGW